MQAVVNVASNAASVAYNTASNLAGAASTYVPGMGAHSHAEEDTRGSKLPADATAEEVKTVDDEGLAVFEEAGVRHEVLVKINQLALDDVKHGLRQVTALELVKDGQKKGIDYYHPKRYFKVIRPSGVDYIGEVEIEDGKSIHIRCHKASPASPATFHSIDTRPFAEGGAVFKTGEPLVWFDY